MNYSFTCTETTANACTSQVGVKGASINAFKQKSLFSIPLESLKDLSRTKNYTNYRILSDPNKFFLNNRFNGYKQNENDDFRAKCVCQTKLIQISSILPCLAWQCILNGIAHILQTRYIFYQL